MRKRLPDERESVTHKFRIYSKAMGETKCYVTVGLYEDGKPGELFIRMQKQGSTLGTLMDQWAIAVSICLQQGVPIKTLVDKFAFCKFEPMGMTTNSRIPMAHSPIDYVARWLAKRFCDGGNNEREEGQT